jgi:hypothetical protein
VAGEREVRDNPQLNLVIHRSQGLSAWPCNVFFEWFLLVFKLLHARCQWGDAQRVIVISHWRIVRHALLVCVSGRALIVLSSSALA